MYRIAILPVNWIPNKFRISIPGYPEPAGYAVSDTFYVKLFIIYENNAFVAVNI